MLNDFTEQHHLNAALIASQSSYRDLAEVSNDGIVIIQDGKLVFVNRRISEIFEFTEEEMLGRPFTEFIPLEDRERVKQSYLSRLAGARSTRPLEMALETQNGSRRDVGFNGGLTVYQGAPAVVAYVRDISSRKKMKMNCAACRLLSSRTRP